MNHWAHGKIPKFPKQANDRGCGFLPLEITPTVQIGRNVKFGKYSFNQIGFALRWVGKSKFRSREEWMPVEKRFDSRGAAFVGGKQVPPCLLGQMVNHYAFDSVQNGFQE